MKISIRGAIGVFIMMILIIFLVSTDFLAAEETLPTPEEIIAKNIEAMGGKKALEKIKNRKIVLSGKIVPMGIEAKLTYYQERPNKHYALTDLGTMGKERAGSDGKIAWVVSPFSGTRILEGEELANTLLQNSFNGPDGYDTPYKMMKTEGVEQINGKDCYKVVKTPEIGTPRTIYYDKDNFLIVKAITESKSPQGKFKTEAYYDVYQKVDGILFPRKIITFMMGQKYNEISFDKIELNNEMPEGIFDTPEEIKAIMKEK